MSPELILKPCLCQTKARQVRGFLLRMALLLLTPALLPLTARAQSLPVNDNTSKPYVAVFGQGLYSQDGFRRDNNFAAWLNRSQVWATTFNTVAGGGNTWTWSDLEGGSGSVVGLGGGRWVRSHPGTKFIFSTGMLPGTGGTPLSGVSLARGARGDYDDHFISLAQKFVSAGIVNDTIIRLGWEFNGFWYPWCPDKDSTENQPLHFAAFFAHIVEVMRNVPGASGLKFCWNGCVQYTEYNVATAFPSNVPAGTTTTGVSWQAHTRTDYVDYVGVDVYDTSYTVYEPDTFVRPPTASQFNTVWTNLKGSTANTNNGILKWQQIADLYGKEMAFPEWSLSGRDDGPNNPDGGGDNPRFIDAMYAYIQDPARNVGFHTYYDVVYKGADGRLSALPGGTPSVYPNSARRFKQLWGLPMPNRAEIGTISAVSAADGISVSGGGAGYKAGTTDTFYFTSRNCATIDSFTVKITAASLAAGQAGVMARQGTGTGSVYGALDYSNGTLTFRSRAAAGAGAAGASVSGVALPVWLKLARNGNSVTGYRSTDGLNWTYVDGRSVGFTAAAQIGVAVSSGDTATLNVVEVDSLDNANLVLGQETSITNKILKDNADSTGISYSGTGASWSTGSTRDYFYGANYRAASVATGDGSIIFTPGITAADAGLYEVYLHWPQDADLHSDTPITINRVGGSTFLAANQQAGYREWVHAGTYNLAAGSSVTWGNSLSPDTGSYTIADAVMFVPLPAALAAPVVYEAETVAGITASDAVSVFNETTASGGAGSKLASNAVGDFIQYPLLNVPAGSYTVKVRYKRNTTRGIFQLSIDGTDYGPTVDEYGTGAYVEATLGTVKKTLSAGTHNFRFRVTGRNAANTTPGAYDLTVDSITLEP